MNAFICDGLRTAIGNLGGSLATVRPDDMAAEVIRQLLRKNNFIDPALIDDVLLGCANQAGEDNRNVARMSALLASLPVTVPGETVNRLCASGMAAVINAARAVHCNEGEILIAGGVESMTRAPWVMSKATQAFGRDSQLFDSSFGWRFINPKMQEMYGTDAMGETAENLAELYNISREDQDKFALWSQQKTAIAVANRIFENEIVELSVSKGKNETVLVKSDEFPKPTSSLEKLASLKPAFRKNGSVTAGNSSGLNDGAAALIIASDGGLKKSNLKPITRIVASAVAGVEPRIMGIGPVHASELALKRAGLQLDQMDIIEMNEAFAAQVLACTRKLHLADNDTRINPNGGAIALGHPLGMTGARMLLTASRELERTGKKFALCTMCIGVGQGYAVVIERI